LIFDGCLGLGEAGTDCQAAVSEAEAAENADTDVNDYAFQPSLEMSDVAAAPFLLLVFNSFQKQTRQLRILEQAAGHLRWKIESTLATCGCRVRTSLEATTG